MSAILLRSLLRLSPAKKPTAPRFFAPRQRLGFLGLLLATLCLVANPASLAAQENLLTLTEAEAVDIALSTEAITALREARSLAASGRIAQTRLWPNPLIALEREHDVIGPSREAETSLIIEQAVPLPRRRRLHTDAARAEAEAVDAESHLFEAAIATEVRAAFYELLLAQHLRDGYGDAQQRLGELIGVMERRVEAGDAAPYELERLRLEEAELRATLAGQEATLHDHTTYLSGWLDTDATIIATGDLLPEQLPTVDDLDDAIAAHPRFQAAQHRIDALDLRHQAAAQWWLPDLFLSGGFVMSNDPAATEPARSLGYIAGIGIALPLFDRGQALRQVLDGESLELQWTINLERDLLLARADSLARRAREFHEATEAYRVDGLERSHRVLALARQAYDGGESTILELIDAHQGVLAAEIRAAELAIESRRALLELLELLSSTGDAP